VFRGIDLKIPAVVSCVLRGFKVMPLHDPIPYERVAELIGTAEPSQQFAILHDAWRTYAATAGGPTHGRLLRSMRAST
jgi:hypothetical protein